MAFKIQLATIALVATTAGTVMPTISEQAYAQARNCYLDDRGRIVTRRRPGYQKVDCPNINQPRQTDTTTSNTTGGAPQNQPPAPVPDQPIMEGASSVFFKEVVPGSPTDEPVPADNSQGQQVLSPSQSGLYQLPSRQTETTTTIDGKVPQHLTLAASTYLAALNKLSSHRPLPPSSYTTKAIPCSDHRTTNIALHRRLTITTLTWCPCRASMQTLPEETHGATVPSVYRHCSMTSTCATFLIAMTSTVSELAFNPSQVTSEAFCFRTTSSVYASLATVITISTNTISGGFVVLKKIPTAA